MALPLPSVVVVIPVLNEAATIDDCLASLRDQDYEGPMEVIVVDGGSTDATLAKLDGWRQQMPVRVMHNPHMRQSFAVNRGAAETDADVLVRADAHTRYDPDYVRRSVESLVEAEHAAVGGNQVAEATNAFGRAVGIAMRRKGIIGTAKYHHTSERHEVRRGDGVYLGTFWRKDFLSAGGFRDFPSGVAEDADFFWRWGAVLDRPVVVDPAIRSSYRPRHRPGALWAQYFRYGRGKSEMLYVNRVLPSLRPLAPAVFVLAVAALLLVWALAGWWWPVAALGLVWLAWVGAFALVERSPLLIPVALIMHLGYGAGFWWSLFTGPRRVRRHLATAESRAHSPR